MVKRVNELPLTHYEVLSIARTASLADIRAAYVRLVKIYHPDRAPPRHRAAAVKMFQAITEAYATLRKPALRASYDQSLEGEATAMPLNDNSRGQPGLWGSFREMFR